MKRAQDHKAPRVSLEKEHHAERASLGDLDTPEQIAELVRRFYAKVDRDDLLGPIFNDVAQVVWPHHLSKLTAYWCRALLSMPGYQGNPYRAHILISSRRSFTYAHFERWLKLFDETMCDGWEGPKTAQARELAHKVAMVHSRQIVGEGSFTDERTGSASS